MAAGFVGFLIGVLVALVVPELFEGFRDDPWEGDE